MNLIEILSILLIHWIADFVCQTDWQATNKSKEWLPLLSHTITYNMVFAIPLIFYMIFTQNYMMAWFPVITFICHTATDYFTSRINSKLWAEKKVHYFFVSIGFDQWLHYVQLFLTYWLLKNG